MSRATLEQLKGVALFQGAHDDDLRALAERAARRVLPGGRLVFREGEAASSLYIVLAGGVKIFLTDETGKEVVLDTKQAGEYFGEMMLDHRPRSASVMTLERSEFAVLSRDDFRYLMREHPDVAEKVILNLIHVGRTMNERLRQYVNRLDSVDVAALPSVRRWSRAKRWALGGLVVLAAAQYYFLDVLQQIVSYGSLTTFR